MSLDWLTQCSVTEKAICLTRLVISWHAMSHSNGNERRATADTPMKDNLQTTAPMLPCSCYLDANDSS